MNAPDISGTWDRAKDAYDKALAASEAIGDYHDALPTDAPHHDAIAELVDAAVLAEMAAFDVVMTSPSSGIDAFAWKVGKLFGQAARDGGHAPMWPAIYLDAILADVERIGGAA